jgi:hypothetical protein
MRSREKPQVAVARKAAELRAKNRKPTLSPKLQAANEAHIAEAALASDGVRRQHDEHHVHGARAPPVRLLDKGKILAIVSISGGSVSGGTLETTGGGQILIGGETVDGSNGHTVNNTGSVLSEGGMTLLGTISNTGTIAGQGGVLYIATGGATLSGSGSVTLADATSSTIEGSGASTTLTNQNTISGAGTIGGNGLLLTNQGVIDATGTNPLIVDTGTSAVTNSGTLEATNNATLFVASNVTNTGHLIANNGDVIFAGAVSGNGTATVQGAGSIEFGSTTTANTTFAAGANGTVTFDAASSLTGKLSITGFALGDTIDLADINFSGSGPTLAFSKGVLTVSDGTHVAKLNMIGNYTLASFHATPDGGGGTVITDPPLAGQTTASAPPNNPPGLDHVAGGKQLGTFTTLNVADATTYSLTNLGPGIAYGINDSVQARPFADGTVHWNNLRTDAEGRA